jgi:SAM-dependent methyltransferase
VGSIVWGPEIAEAYDASSAAMFNPATLNPTIEVLLSLAGQGPVLELAVGTGRVALALQQRGMKVHGIELSQHMANQLRSKPGGENIPVTIGDMTTAHAAREFSLVYLVFNTIMNVTTQDEQIAVFENASRHLCPGGRFVLEVAVPQLSKPEPGALGRPFALDEHHIGIDTLDDPIAQILTSHHWIDVGGRLTKYSQPFRYVWPSELDLMARIAHMQLETRWGDWDRCAFTAASAKQVVVYQKAS